MIFEILLGLIGAYSITKFKDTTFLLGKIIWFGLMVAVVASVFPLDYLKAEIYPVLMLCSILTCIYAFIIYFRSKNSRNLMLILAIGTFIPAFFKYYQLQGAIFTLFLAVPALYAFFLIYTRKKAMFKREMSFILLLAGNALFIAIRLVISIFKMI